VARLPRCVVCTRDVESVRVPRCAHCKAALCPLILRDCQAEHMAARHPRVQQAVDLELTFPAGEPEPVAEEPPAWRESGGWQ